MDAQKACLEAQRIEHEVLKTPCGLLDQMAMMYAKQGNATLIDFSSHSTESIEIPSTWLFKLIDSGVHRQLSQTYQGSAEQEVRLAHIQSENKRVRSSLGASAPDLGVLLNASHASLKSLGVSHPDVDEQVRKLQQTDGVYGARMMGGGYGGMILVLVEHAQVLPNYPVYRASHGSILEEFLE
jgi:galactokinase